MDTKIASRSKKLLRDILSLVKSDNRRMATSFYIKKQKRGGKIGFGVNF